jgi:hypothetical protein
MYYTGPLISRHIHRLRTFNNRVLTGKFKTEWEEVTKGKINLHSNMLYNLRLHEIYCDNGIREDETCLVYTRYLRVVREICIKNVVLKISGQEDTTRALTEEQY